MKAFLDYILRMDRRWIFLIVFFATVIPFFVPMGLDVRVTDEVKKVYDFVNALDATSKPILLSFDYDPQIKAECHPMALAILRHAFSRNIKVVAITLHPNAPALVLDALKVTSKEYKKKYGEDYCFMGYGAGFALLMARMAESFPNSFPKDYYGTPIKDIQLGKNLENYDSFSIVITLAGNKAPELYIIYGQSKSGVKIAAGVTAVMAADYYPFLSSGQLTGLISGLKGATEYEQLINHRDAGFIGMDAQSIVHILIVFFILMGNIAFFATGKHKRR